MYIHIILLSKLYNVTEHFLPRQILCTFILKVDNFAIICLWTTENLNAFKCEVLIYKQS